ncbi:MAG: hypothetical protein TEF_06115 [Rhizobiales bacterium NRL2]|nr:MAG: hypothetical protein TEF_06115 [Rhizobiales bacterium NRL2]
MTSILSDAGMDLIFRHAGTHGAWLDKPVADVSLHALYDLVRQGPTDPAGATARLRFLKSPEAKARLAPALPVAEREPAMSAPVIVVVAHDSAGAEDTGNAAMQSAYVMIAARALGLDCGPISGFDAALVDAAFFPGGGARSCFVCAIGHGDPSALQPPGDRPAFAEACEIL